MKPYLIILILMLCSEFSSAQDKKENFFFNEVSISANRTFGYDQNTVGQFGFGVGLDRVMFKEKRVNLTVGMGYNYLRIKMKKVKLELYDNLSDAKYRMNILSIPIGLRFNIGENKRFFIEAGHFIDLMIAAKVRATETVAPPFINENHPSYEINEINRQAGLPVLNVGTFLGFGFRLPLNDFHSLFIKANYNLLLPISGFNSDNDYFMLSYAKIAVAYSFGL